MRKLRPSDWLPAAGFILILTVAIGVLVVASHAGAVR
jgi:hypothetical protein